MSCAGLADGTGCHTSVFDGTCHEGACFPPRCGDQVIEGTEQCDGSLDVDCVDFGFDLGVPLCASCVLDLTNTCVRFGWRQVLTATANGVWTDGNRFSVIRHDQTGVDVYDAHGALLGSAPGVYFGTTGNAHLILAWTTQHMDQFDGTAFAPVDLGAIAGTLEWAVLDSSDVLYVVSVTTGCTVYAKPPGGAFTPVYTSATNDCTALYAHDSDILLAIGSSVRRWDGNAFVPLFTAPDSVTQLVTRQGVVYANTLSRMIRYDGTQTSFTPASGEAVPLSSGLFNGGGGGPQIARFETNQYEVIAAPIAGHLITDGDKMYIFGNGVYVYTELQYAERYNPNPFEVAISRFQDSSIAMADSLGNVATEQPGNYGYWNYVMIAGSPKLTAVAGASTNDFYATDGTRLFHGVSEVTWPITTSRARALWVPPSGPTALYVVGDQQVGLARATNGTWTSLAAPAGITGCDLLDVTGDATTVVAAGTCGTDGVVWKLEGTSWTEIHRGAHPLSAIAIDAAGELFAAGPAGGARAIGGAWSDDAGAVGVSIAATSPDDVWVAGGPGEVIHWDGVSWSRLGVIGAAAPRVVATERAVYISGVSKPVLLR